MKYLTKVTEVYRLDSEHEVEVFLKELKADARFEVAKYSSVKKEKKKQGEIIDSWIHFEVTKLFNSETEPDSEIEILYRKDYDNEFEC